MEDYLQTTILVVFYCLKKFMLENLPHINYPKPAKLDKFVIDMPKKPDLAGEYSKEEFVHWLLARLKSDTNFSVEKNFFDSWNSFVNEEEIISKQRITKIFYQNLFPELFVDGQDKGEEVKLDDLAEKIKKKTTAFLINSPQWQRISAYYIVGKYSFSLPKILLCLNDELKKKAQNQPANFSNDTDNDTKKKATYDTGEIVNSINNNFQKNYQGEDIVEMNTCEDIAADLGEKIGKLDATNVQEIAELFYKDFCKRIGVHIHLYETREHNSEKLRRNNFLTKEEYIKNNEPKSMQGLITIDNTADNTIQDNEVILNKVGLFDTYNILNQSGFLTDFFRENDKMYSRLRNTLLYKIIIFSLIFEKENRKTQ